MILWGDGEAPATEDEVEVVEAVVLAELVVDVDVVLVAFDEFDGSGMKGDGDDEVNELFDSLVVSDDPLVFKADEGGDDDAFDELIITEESTTVAGTDARRINAGWVVAVVAVGVIDCCCCCGCDARGEEIGVSGDVVGLVEDCTLLLTTGIDDDDWLWVIARGERVGSLLLLLLAALSSCAFSISSFDVDCCCWVDATDDGVRGGGRAFGLATSSAFYFKWENEKH